MSYMIGEAGNSAWGTEITLPSYKENGPVEVEFMFNLKTDEFEIIGIWMELKSSPLTNDEKLVEVDVSIFPSPCMEAIDILNTRREDIIKYEQVRI